MTQSIFDGKRALFLWMFSAQAEHTWQEAIATARQLAGADLLLVKAMDGTQWMSDFDRAPGAIFSQKQLQQGIALAVQSGLTVVPWVVANRRNDAAMHAQLGPTLVIDLEPYPQFWEEDAEAAAGYLADLAAAGVSDLYVSIDPRQHALDSLGVASWAARVSGLLPQLYWTDFQQSALATLDLLAPLLALGCPIIPVLPGDGAADFLTFWTAAQAAGCPGVAAWRLGSMDTTALQAFRQLNPLRADPCQQIRDQLAVVTAERDQLAATITAIKQALGVS